MPDFTRLLGQGLVYLLAAAVTGYLASRPIYHQVPADMAQIKMSLSHGAERVAECRRLTAEEIAKLPAAQRRPHTCERQRVPIRVQLVVDDAVSMTRNSCQAACRGTGRQGLYQSVPGARRAASHHRPAARQPAGRRIQP
jgi:hypothetical protein